MNKYYLLLLLTPFIAFVSCDKEDDNLEEKEVLANCTYFKVREGTTFTYDYLDGNVQTAEVIEKQDVDGNDLILFRSSNGDESYLNCDGEMMIFTAEEATTLNNEVTIKNIKMDLDLSGEIEDEKLIATINNTQSVNGYTFTQTVKYYGKVVARDMSMEVGGMNYSDVVEYHIRTTNTVSGLDIPTSNSKYYFAPEVAYIQWESRDTGGTIIGGGELREYVY